MSAVIFAMHTVPDTQTGVRKYNLGDLPEKDAIKAIMHLQQQSGKPELPAYMQRIAVISAIFIDDTNIDGDSDNVHVTTWGDDNQSETSVLKPFLSSLAEKHISELISWDFISDQPILLYRCLKNTVQIQRVNEMKLVSLKEELSCHQLHAQTQQENILHLLGIKQAPTLTQEQIWEHWRKGKYADIQQSCNHQVLDRYKIYQHYCSIVS